jgi:hypothetical protein
VVVRVHPAAAFLSALLVWGAAAVSQAQEAPEPRPSHPLFGAPDPRDPPPGVLNGGLVFSGSLFGGYDDSLLGGDGLVTPPQLRPQVSGTYTGYFGRLVFDRLSDHLNLRADVSSTGRYYPGYDRFVLGKQMIDLSLGSTMSPWRGAHLSTGGAAQYARFDSPYSALAPIPDDPMGFTEGAGDINLRSVNTVLGSVQLEQDWSRRRSLAMLASARTSEIDGSERVYGYEVGGTYSTRLARYGQFRAGYTRREIDRGITRYGVHDVNLGGNYARPLSASRRAYVTFGAGTAALESRDYLRVFAVADASLRYQFKRSWTGSVRYYRGVTFVDEITEPLLSNNVLGQVDGLLSPRLQLLVSGFYGRGDVGLSRLASNYEMSSASSQLRFALSRTAAVHAEYLFYHYRFPESVHQAGNLPSKYYRQAVRVGISFTGRLIN